MLRNRLGAMLLLCLLAACGSPFERRELTTDADLARARTVAEDNQRRYMAGLEVAPEGGNLGLRIRRDPTTGFVSVQVIGRVTAWEGQINNGTYIFTSDAEGRINLQRGPIAAVNSAGEPMGTTAVRGAFQVLAGAVNGVASAGIMAATACGSNCRAGAGVVNVVSANAGSLADARSGLDFNQTTSLRGH